MSVGVLHVSSRLYDPGTGGESGCSERYSPYGHVSVYGAARGAPDIREVPYGIVLPVPVGVQGSGRGATRVIEYAKGFGARLTPSLHDKR